MLAAFHRREAKPFSWKVLHRQFFLPWFCSGDSCKEHRHSVTPFSDLFSGTLGAVVPPGDTEKAETLLWATWCHRAWCGGGCDAQSFCSLRSVLSKEDGSCSHNVPETRMLVRAWVPAMLTGWLALTWRARAATLCSSIPMLSHSWSSLQLLSCL